MKTVNLALMGFGNAARAFARILLEKEAMLAADYDACIRVTAIATGSRGALVDERGIDLQEAIRQIEEDGRFAPGHPAYRNLTGLEIAKLHCYDCLVELSPLNIFTGQPAISHIEAALDQKKHVITANKGPIAWAYSRLRARAAEQGVGFFYETTVMDGTPVFNLVQKTLHHCKVTCVEGILNTTTNFVLEELAKGQPYEAVMEEGRRRGFVEADPSMDLDGWDAAAKLTALLNVLMDADLTPMDIDRTGIGSVTAEQMAEAAERGKVIKLLCHGHQDAQGLHAWVRPTEVEAGSLWATITGTSSVVSIETDLMGKVSVVEHDPELPQTGYGVYSDLTRLLEEQY
jgi:homoserine dehydrogenase